MLDDANDAEKYTIRSNKNMNIAIKDVRFEHEKLYSNGILVEMILINTIINATVTIGKIIIEGSFKFDYDGFNYDSSIKDYENAIKNLFKGE
jgi:hypothetical protein